MSRSFVRGIREGESSFPAVRTKVTAARMTLISPSSSITQRHLGIKKLRSAVGRPLGSPDRRYHSCFAQLANVYDKVVVTIFWNSIPRGSRMLFTYRKSVLLSRPLLTVELLNAKQQLFRLRTPHLDLRSNQDSLKTQNQRFVPPRTLREKNVLLTQAKNGG